MLTKILVTALIILACYYYLRYQKNKQQSVINQNNSPVLLSPKSSIASQIKWVASGLIVLMVCAVLGTVVYSWLDNRQILTIKVTSPYSGEVVTYQVYKGDMEERSFKTTQGQQVSLGNSERIEVTQEETTDQ